MLLDFKGVEYIYQCKLNNLIILPKLVQHFGYARWNIYSNAITLIFVEFRHCLLINNNNLVDI